MMISRGPPDISFLSHDMPLPTKSSYPSEHVFPHGVVARHAEALVHRLGFVVGRVGVETEAGSALARAPFPRVPVELPEDALRAPLRHDVYGLDPPRLFVPPVGPLVRDHQLWIRTNEREARVSWKGGGLVWESGVGALRSSSMPTWPTTSPSLASVATM